MDLNPKTPKPHNDYMNVYISVVNEFNIVDLYRVYGMFRSLRERCSGEFSAPIPVFLRLFANF